MAQHVSGQHLQIFEGRKVRTVWDESAQEWYFSVADVVSVLTDSSDVKQYIKKMRTRDPELGARWGTICTPTRMMASDGKYYNTQASNMEGIFRIIQSIPSPKAEPFKQWMSQVAASRVNQMIDPELSIEQAMDDYRRLGYTESWINQRLKTIEIRKGLTDEWKRGGITKAIDFATLTDLMSKTWSGLTTREYKRYKGLTKENLRDNMTNMELLLNALAEESASQLSKERNPEGFVANATVAKEGAEVAKIARDDFEKRLGRSVISSERAIDHLNPSGSLPLNEAGEFGE
jgi:hypothetical protein